MNKELTKDLERKRRDYLRTKAGGNFWATVGVGFLIPFGVLAIVFLCASLYSMAKGDLYSADDVVWPSLISFAITGGIAYRGYRTYRFNIDIVKSLPYVPPVAEQIANLPAEEILLRGSDQPTAAPEELLRAAHDGKVNPSDELLRPEPAEEHLQQIAGGSA